ncbi:NfeD family protein [Thalassotalea atypica]|uniref:NfeD family protein n=1 Tax=Thalassotalea atypica TaxID=2054316 RepID=UPI002573F346|nr:NfeD family protein [Thalassotalea atypica]
MEFFVENHDKLLYAIGGLSLVIELSIMGLSGPLLFFALGCIFTGLLVTFVGLSSWEYEALSVGLSSIAFAALLWKPLKKLQGKGAAIDTSSDMIGKHVAVSETISNNAGSIRYSGINWQARLSPESERAEIAVGENVEIIGVNGTIMLVNTI